MVAARMAGAPSSPTTDLAHESGSKTGVSQKRKSTMAGTSPSTVTRSWTTGAMAANTAASKASAGHGVASPSSHGRHASTKSEGAMARMYSPFMWVSLATSKKAGEWLTSSSANHDTI